MAESTSLLKKRTSKGFRGFESLRLRQLMETNFFYKKVTYLISLISLSFRKEIKRNPTGSLYTSEYLVLRIQLIL